MAHKMKRSHYAEMFGPTTGDRVKLGDTSLTLEVERDHTSYGDECKFGGGKVLRDRMGQMAGLDVSTKTLKNASKWLDGAAVPDGGAYGYTGPGEGVATTSA